MNLLSQSLHWMCETLSYMPCGFEVQTTLPIVASGSSPACFLSSVQWKESPAFGYETDLVAAAAPVHVFHIRKCDLL
jgi:hypothetical protein